jgi:hypothetical protein
VFFRANPSNDSLARIEANKVDVRPTGAGVGKAIFIVDFRFKREYKLSSLGQFLSFLKRDFIAHNEKGCLFGNLDNGLMAQKMQIIRKIRRSIFTVRRKRRFF